MAASFNYSNWWLHFVKSVSYYVDVTSELDPRA